MRRYILTGTPGAGKTTLLHLLRARGYATVEEAATDVIAREQARGRPEPWTHEEFVDQVLTLQRERQLHAPYPDVAIEFHDRSAVCTYALSTHLGRSPSPLLLDELDRISRDAVYQPHVFFIANLGFCEPTAARRISYADSLAFEQVHRDSYQAHGYQLIDIPAAPAAERAEAIIKAVDRLGAPRAVANHTR
jgi:predicted ATPase